MRAKHFISEQRTGSVREYTLRVYGLALTYCGIVVAAVTAIALILSKAKLFVTLSQRSNVETLTIAVVLVLFLYLAVVAAPGALGALRILWYNAPRWMGRDALAVERRKQAALHADDRQPDSVYLNCLIRRQSDPAAPVIIPLQDEAGGLGTIRIDGAKMSHQGGLRHSSNSIFGYFEQRIQALVREREAFADVQIVQWTSIDDESALRYGSFVAFSQNLEKHLGSPALWPSVELTEGDLEKLAEEARRLCPALRNEAQLPDVEYEAEHRLPIIPEPLAFISLSRHEQRADPAASMGCAFLVTLFILGLMIWFIWAPPWVPSK